MDPLYAKQEPGGIIYQLVPRPGHPGASVNSAGEYGYTRGVLLPPSGHLRVTVSSGGAFVEYVTSSRLASKNGQVADSYMIERR